MYRNVARNSSLHTHSNVVFLYMVGLRSEFAKT